MHIRSSSNRKTPQSPLSCPSLLLGVGLKLFGKGFGSSFPSSRELIFLSSSSFSVPAGQCAQKPCYEDEALLGRVGGDEDLAAVSRQDRNHWFMGCGYTGGIKMRAGYPVFPRRCTVSDRALPLPVLVPILKRRKGCMSAAQIWASWESPGGFGNMLIPRPDLQGLWFNFSR